MRPAAGGQAAAVWLGEDNRQAQGHRLPGGSLPPAGPAEARAEADDGRGAVWQRLERGAGEHLAALQDLRPGLHPRRTPAGGHLQRRRPLRHPLAGGQPAQHDNGGNGLRHAVRGLQHGRHTRDDRPPAQRLRGTLPVGRGPG